MTASAGASASRIQVWFSALPTWKRRGLAVLAGAAATLGQAPVQAVPAFVAAIVVLIWLLDCAFGKPKRIAAAFGLGWWFGLGHMASGLYWVSSAFLVDTDAWGPFWGVPATFALAGALAIYWGAGLALAMSVWTRDVRRLAAFAAAVFLAEWVRGHLFGGIPWLLAGYVWTPGEPVSQMASLVGVYGLTLLTLLIAAAPAAIADGRVGAGARFAPTVVAALAVGLMWGWGAERLAAAPVDPPGAQPIIRVADSGLSQGEKWRTRPDQEWRVLARYLRASAPPQESGAQIVIWPEGAIPTVNFFMLENPAFMSALGRGLGDRVLVTGLARREERRGAMLYFNSAAVIDGVGGEARVSQIYDKHRLVPFGEFIPLWSLISGLNIAPLQRIGAGFEPGPLPSRLVVPEAPPAVVLICYEAIFPGMVPRGAERPGWIIAVSNDAWFGDPNWFSGPWQHYAMARYRSIEEGLPMARAASGGFSGIVDAFGRAVPGARRSPGALEAQLPPALGETLFARWGFELLAALFSIIAALRFLPLARKGAAE